jgi:hypothetical protein
MGQRKDDGHKKSRWAAGRQQEDRNAIPSRTSGADQIQRGNKAKSGDGFRIAAPTVQAVRKESESKYGKTGMNDTLGSIAVSPGEADKDWRDEIIEKYSSGGLMQSGRDGDEMRRQWEKQKKSQRACPSG